MKKQTSCMLLLMFAITLTGCKPTEPQRSQEGASTPPSGSGIVDVMTQKSKIEAGKRAAEKVRQIDQEQQRELNQIMGGE